MPLADEAQGRIIRQTFSVKLIPPQGGELGDTDAARGIGIGLMREAMRLLCTAAEREGFKVELEEFLQVVL